MTVDLLRDLGRSSEGIRGPRELTTESIIEHQPCIYFFVNAAKVISGYSEYRDRKQPIALASFPTSAGVTIIVCLERLDGAVMDYH